MVSWTKVAAGVIGAAAVVLLAYAVLTPETTDDEHMGMGGQQIYSSENLGLMIVSTIVIIITVAFILTYVKYEPPPQSYAPPPPPSPAEHGAEAAVAADARVGVTKEGPPPQEKIREEAKDRYLVLRLLTGDERIMFKALMDKGGEALQKDLILSTKMSNAKVSRLLDKLEQKGVVTKERYGSTNKIKIKLEP